MHCAVSTCCRTCMAACVCARCRTCSVLQDMHGCMQCVLGAGHPPGSGTQCCSAQRSGFHQCHPSPGTAHQPCHDHGQCLAAGEKEGTCNAWQCVQHSTAQHSAEQNSTQQCRTTAGRGDRDTSQQERACTTSSRCLKTHQHRVPMYPKTAPARPLNPPQEWTCLQDGL